REYSSLSNGNAPERVANGVNARSRDHANQRARSTRVRSATSTCGLCKDRIGKAVAADLGSEYRVRRSMSRGVRTFAFGELQSRMRERPSPLRPPHGASQTKEGTN